MQRDVCSIEGCECVTIARGWCNKHYKRWRRHGSPLGGGTEQGAPMAFLRSLVGTEAGECITWPFGKRVNGGYGLISINGKNWHPSRVVCVLAHGQPISDEMQAAHSCGNGHLGCVNPTHIRWATAQENHKDMDKHGTRPSGGIKVRAEQIQAIQAMRGKATQYEIAAEFGISQTHVSRIMRGCSWRQRP